MNHIRSICVFCGSSKGTRKEYLEEARQLGHILLREDIELIYGGSNIGLMTHLADTVLEGGGKVIGFMPRRLIDKEVAHKGLTEFHVTDSMQERKARMAELADAFITLPGGLGTLDELSEILSWNQLGIIHKPIGILNVQGYYDHLIKMLDHAVEETFIRQEHRDNLIAESDTERLIEKLKTFEPAVLDSKWIDELKH